MRRTRVLVAAALAVGLLRPSGADAQELLTTCENINASSITVRNVRNDPISQGVAQQAKADLAQEISFLCGQVAMTLSNVQPAIGIGFSGGNPVLGTAATLGTRFGMIPRVSLTARANAAFAELPDFFDASEQIGEISSPSDSLEALPTALIPLGSIQADVAVGVFNGFPLAPTLGSIGSVDLLGSVSFIPLIGPVEDAGLEEAIINWGGGARVGILGGGILMPAVSVSGMYRRMGTVEFGDIDAGDPGRFSTDLSVLSLRAIVSKGIALLNLAGGVGYDRYSSDPSFNFALEYDCTSASCTAAKQDPTEPFVLTMTNDIEGELTTSAWNVFANIGLNLFLLDIVGEIGYQKATDVIGADDLSTSRSLTEEELGDGRLFGSFGFRLTL